MTKLSDEPELWQAVRNQCVESIRWHDETGWKARTEALAAILRTKEAPADVAEHYRFEGNQSDLRMRFNEAIAGGPNMSGDSGPSVHTDGHAFDIEQAIGRITRLSADLAEAREVLEYLQRCTAPSKSTSDREDAIHEITRAFLARQETNDADE